MKERFRHELPSWMKKLGICRINKDSIDFNWGYFAPRPGFELLFHRGTYFNKHCAISFCLGWGVFHIRLPFKTKLEEGCDMPRYGIAFHSGTAWIHKGGEYTDGQVQNGWVAWDLPFFTDVFDGHWILSETGDWVRMANKWNSAPSPWEFRTEGAYVEEHPYLFVARDGTEQYAVARCTRERRHWHRKWFPFLKKTSDIIEIEFSQGVGGRVGSWKGGTTGCSWEILPGEAIEDALFRMEQTRKDL